MFLIFQPFSPQINIFTELFPKTSKEVEIETSSSGYNCNGIPFKKTQPNNKTKTQQNHKLFPTVFHTVFKVSSSWRECGIPSLNDRRDIWWFQSCNCSSYSLSFLLIPAQAVEKRTSLPWTSDHMTWTAVPVMSPIQQLSNGDILQLAIGLVWIDLWTSDLEVKGFDIPSLIMVKSKEFVGHGYRKKYSWISNHIHKHFEYRTPRSHEVCWEQLWRLCLDGTK